MGSLAYDTLEFDTMVRLPAPPCSPVSTASSQAGMRLPAPRCCWLTGAGLLPAHGQTVMRMERSRGGPSPPSMGLARVMGRCQPGVCDLVWLFPILPGCGLDAPPVRRP